MIEKRSLSRMLVPALITGCWCSVPNAAGMQAGSGGPGGLRSPDGIPIIQVYEDPDAPRPAPSAAPKPAARPGVSAPPAQGGQRRSGGMGMGSGSGSGYPRDARPDWGMESGYPAAAWGPEAAAPGPSGFSAGSESQAPWPGEPGMYDAWPAQPEGMGQSTQGWYPPPPAPDTGGYAPFDYALPETAAEPLPEGLGQPVPVPEVPAAGSGGYPFEFPQPRAASQLPIPAGEGFGLSEQGTPAWPPMGPFGYRSGPGFRGMPPGFMTPFGAGGMGGDLEQRLQRIEQLLLEILDNQRQLLPPR